MLSLKDHRYFIGNDYALLAPHRGVSIAISWLLATCIRMKCSQHVGVIGSMLLCKIHVQLIPLLQ